MSSPESAGMSMEEQRTQTPKRPSAFVKEMRANWDLYLLLLPGIVYLAVFAYTPMLGLQIAFKDYNMFLGMLKSPWNNFTHFKGIPNMPDIYRIVRNTLMLNLLGLLFSFPSPIILSLMLNEMRAKTYKRIMQSLLYLPHFLSWIILGAIVIQMLSPSTGIINKIMMLVGLEPIYFMTHNAWWIFIYIVSGIWAGVGWGTIIYLAAITNVDPTLYEAALIDGAGRFKRMFYITVPCIAPQITIFLIMNVGSMMSSGIEKPMALENVAVRNVSKVLGVYIYDMGIQNVKFAQTTALGMVLNIINLILLITTNRVAKSMGSSGLF